MAKKRSFEDDLPPLEDLDGDFAPEKPNPVKEKLTWLSGKAFNIAKLLMGLSILPFVYSVSLSFLAELPAIGQHYEYRFWQGVVGFLIMYLFLWEPALIYSRGQKILEFMFGFIKPMVKVAPYLLPIYSVVLFIAYWPATHFLKDAREYFVVGFGFASSLHLVFSAKTLRGKKGDFLKSNYIFGFSFVYILNVLFAGFCLNLLFPKYPFIRFISSFYGTASAIFASIFNQLFMAK